MRKRFSSWRMKRGSRGARSPFLRRRAGDFAPLVVGFGARLGAFFLVLATEGREDEARGFAPCNRFVSEPSERPQNRQASSSTASLLLSFLGFAAFLTDFHAEDEARETAFLAYFFADLTSQAMR